MGGGGLEIEQSENNHAENSLFNIEEENYKMSALAWVFSMCFKNENMIHLSWLVAVAD